MIQAFYTGVSGLMSQQSAIDVTSNNIANVSTVGFRGYNTEFASLFETAVNTDSGFSSVNSGIGIGSRVQTSSMNQTDGSLMLSERNTDLAIYGDGWFGISGNSQTAYTRAGNFTFDKNNDLVTPDGYFVLGTMGKNISNDVLVSSSAETLLNSASSQTPLRFPNVLTYPPEATTQASFQANLGVLDESRTVSAGVIDSTGVKNNLKLTFSKSATQVPPGAQWDVVATVGSLDGATIYSTQSGVVSFDATGAQISNTLTSIDNKGTAVAIDLGENYSGIVSTNGTISGGSSTSNGTIGGDLVGYEINRNADVIATFTNGKQSSVGRIGVFHFQNEQGLDRVDGTKFAESSNSGKPIFYQDTNGKNILGAEVINYKLENSNVSLESALTELIIFQRTFDASGKIVTAADEMLQKALGMHK
ncbi:flagellar hook protein FlgE [Sulfurimonas sp.]|uniref:flagellar hook protein FlgE n=1 Tax=Sulfurimonas sp. TaxID=2022749 RepID=UPI0025D77709|nr:flagellar hook-basal body complex protein [Sulfurimonas sp.]MDD5157772.1 flagellar hook-basal body complex protein [Sulfurimonas sp.]